VAIKGSGMAVVSRSGAEGEGRVPRRPTASAPAEESKVWAWSGRRRRGLDVVLPRELNGCLSRHAPRVRGGMVYEMTR